MLISHWLRDFRTLRRLRKRNARCRRPLGLRCSQSVPVEILEERALLAADLTFVSAKLVDGNFNDAPSPTVGEQLGVLVTWETQDLPADSTYRIDAEVDGVSASVTVSLG